MRPLAALMFFLPALLLWPAAAQASGDVGCRPRWSHSVIERSGCGNRAALTPANDTRVNLVLLMLEERGATLTGGPGPLPPVEFSWFDFRRWHVAPADDRVGYAVGEGSRCRSNEGGAADFVVAVRAARGLSDADRAALIAAREAYRPNCEAAKPFAPPAVARGAQPSADYLAAAAAFYAGDFGAAARGFAELADARDPWLAETARYMAGRVEVNRAQVGAFDEWGYPANFNKIDRAVLARAEAGLDGYLARHPRGRYALSARGLLRRVWWLRGDRRRLATAYAALMRQDPVARGMDDLTLAEEIDTKLGDVKPGETTDPLLLAVALLKRMRDDEAMTVAALDEQRAAFAGEPALWTLLRATAGLHVVTRPAEALRLLPDQPARASTPLAFSGQLLRAMALEATRDPGAREHWLRLLPASPAPLQRSLAELGLALHEERAGRLPALLATGSPLTTPVIRETLLLRAADAALLRRAARDTGAPRHERELALFVLLYKQLGRGQYAGFLQDLAMLPADAPADLPGWGGLIATERVPLGLFGPATDRGDYDCPALRQVAEMLAANPRQAKARLCLADFFRANGFDDNDVDERPAADELGGARALFPGTPWRRATVYDELIADPATPADDRAYALYRAIRCYAPNARTSCGGPEVPLAQRKAWWERLTRIHWRSPWAKKQTFYW